MAIKRFASIDVGSFELEMGIYEIDSKRGLRLLDSVRHVIALGSDTYATGVISYEMLQELLPVLEDFARIMKGYRCTLYRAVATSAMREAKNNMIVLDQIRTRTGIDVKIISNSEQRMLGLKALKVRGEHFEDLIQEGTAIVEIGFGSMQITLYDKGMMVGTQNLKLGALRLRDTLEGLNDARREEALILGEMVDHELDLYKRLHLRERNIKHLIAVGDPVRVMFDRVMRKLSRDPRRENLLDRASAERIYSYITKRTHAELEQGLDVGTESAEILIPSAIVCERILDALKPEQVWFAGISLIDGIAADYALEHKLLKTEHDFDADIRSAVWEIGARYGEEPKHRAYALENTRRLFDTIRKCQGFQERDRLLLEIAAMLHHCGRFINMGKASASSCNIIRATEIVGLSAKEHELISQVLKNEEGSVLWSEMSMRAAKFTAMIRLAGALDRSAKQKSGGYKMKLNEKNQLIISANKSGNLALERLDFERNKAFFSGIFGIEPILREKRGA